MRRFLVAANRWAKAHEAFELTQMRICYELGAVSVDVDEQGKREKVAVVPDAWLLFEKLERGRAPVAFPVLLEIDRGTMFSARFKRHVVARIEFVRSGGYSQMFGRKGALIAYATTGQTGEIREGRRKALCLWTKEALKETGRESSFARLKCTSLRSGLAEITFHFLLFRYGKQASFPKKQFWERREVTIYEYF